MNTQEQNANRWIKLKRLIENQKMGTRLSFWAGEWIDEDKIAYIKIGEETHSYADREINFDDLLDSIPEPICMSTNICPHSHYYVNPKISRMRCGFCGEIVNIISGAIEEHKDLGRFDSRERKCKCGEPKGHNGVCIRIPFVEYIA